MAQSKKGKCWHSWVKHTENRTEVVAKCEHCGELKKAKIDPKGGLSSRSKAWQSLGFNN